MNAKHPEYDSPFRLIVNDIALEIAKKVDDACWKAVQKASIEVDKEKLLEALKQDSARYREAFQKGHETGYEHRDDEIIRCKDCKNSELWYGDKRRCFLWNEDGIDVFNDGFCNYGERRFDDG